MNLSGLISRIFKNGNKVKVSEISIGNTTQTAYYYLLALEIAKSVIANAISNCDFKFFYNGTENKKSAEYYRWNIKPNINEDGVQFKKRMVAKLIDDNEVLIFENGKSLYIADSFLKNNDMGLGEFTFENIVVNSETVKRSLKRSEVVYIKLNDSDINVLTQGVAASLATVLGYAIDGFKNSNSAKYKYKIEGLSIGDEKFFEKMTEIKTKQLQPFMENQNAVFPEFDGNELTKFENKDNKTSGNVIDLRKDVFSVVANALHIPINLMLGGSVDDETAIRFITDCIEPILNVIKSGINCALFDFKGFENGNKCEIDSSSISLSLLVKVSTACEKLLSSGLANIDEIRELILHLSKLNTSFSTKYWITKNFEEIEKALKGGAEE